MKPSKIEIPIEILCVEKDLPIKLLSDKAKVPTYGSDDAAGMDIYAAQDAIIPCGETVKISTGIATAIPKGFVGLVYARSGLATKQGLAPANKVAVIDADYRGEWFIPLHNHSNEPREIKTGDRIAQVIITPYITCNTVVVEELDDTVRGAGGFGSTGTN